MRRVAGQHNVRLDGIGDLLLRARNASVMDIGCNRGMVAYEFANNGASVVHGCDNYEPGVRVAQEVFMDLRAVQSQFEVVDLLQGADALKPFEDRRYDIVLMLATYHKLKRAMELPVLSDFMVHLGKRTNRFFAWRGTHDKNESKGEMEHIDRDMKAAGLWRIHTSFLSQSLGAAAIWAR